ncbi:hypothetical protein SK128_024685 [Halocaridina rubra]|uniref:Uncharacterized protein n=1 Tax=Halocaridina rubra TaxID=373956 RepID=A0AAN8WY05_HALRR
MADEYFVTLHCCVASAGQCHSEAVSKNIVALKKELNLEVGADDVTELLEYHGEELSAEDLIQLEK